MICFNMLSLTAERNKNETIYSKEWTVVASVDTNLKSGTLVDYAYEITKEAVNQNREFNLVNARTGKISRAKKYDVQSNYNLPHASEINPVEFFHCS